jgi:hypothetical protein
MLRAAIAASLLLAAGAPAPRGAAPAPRAQPDGAAEGMRLLDEGAYLRGIDALEKAALGPDGAIADDTAWQIWTQARPMIGAYAPPLPMHSSQPPLAAEDAAKIARARREDALQAIVTAARHSRLVILNEAHQSPRDRAFALEVARALRPLDYSLLAAEAFINHTPLMTQLAREGFPRLATGTYVKEPIFGDFVRQALASGYAPVAYEQTGEQRRTGEPGIAGREQAQAVNLAAILAAHPAAKILVYVGFDHVAEAPLPGGERPIEWMAARLRKMTGIDPVTIDQATLSEDAISRAGREGWALAARGLRRSAILMLDGRPLVLGRYAGAVDLQIVHPPVRLVGGRPDWLDALGRKPRPVPAALLPKRGRRLVQAFLAAESGDAVPIDQILVEAGKPIPRLMLPERPIRYAVQDPGGASEP